MRETPRDFTPGRVALRAIEHGQVVEHGDITGFVRQRGAAQHQNAASARGVDDELFAPFAKSAAQMPRERLGECRELRLIAFELGQRLTKIMRRADAENRLGRAIGDAQASVLIEAEHAGGQTFQQRDEPRALLLGFLRALLHARARELDLARHLRERIDQKTELVVARDRQRRVVPAGADRARRGDQSADRRDETARDAERRERDHQRRQQQRERQDQRERQFQRSAQEFETLEIEICILDAARQCLQTRRQRKQTLQETLAARHVARDGTPVRSMSRSPIGSAAA